MKVSLTGSAHLSWTHQRPAPQPPPQRAPHYGKDPQAGHWPMQDQKLTWRLAGPARSRKNPPAQAPRHPCRQGHRQGQAQMLRDRPSLTACPDTLVSSRRGPWPDPWSPGGQGTKLIQGQDWQSRVPQTVARGSSKWESRIPSRDPLPQTLPQPLQLGPRRGPSSIYLRAHVAPEPGSRPRAPA